MVSLILSEISVSWDAGSSFAGWCPVGEIGRGCTDGSVSSAAEGRNEQVENTTPVTSITQSSYHLDQWGGSDLAHGWLCFKELLPNYWIELTIGVSVYAQAMKKAFLSRWLRNAFELVQAIQLIRSKWRSPKRPRSLILIKCLKKDLKYP